MERQSTLKLALGAASLFLFLIGVKRTFRTEDGTYVHSADAEKLIATDSIVRR